LRKLETRFLRRIFGFNREEVTVRWRKLRGPFAKFVDSPYYSDSELYGGAVTVSFSMYLHLQAMYLQRSTLQTVDHFEIPRLGAPFSWLEKPRNRMG
jgi:hypothetical protein